MQLRWAGVPLSRAFDAIDIRPGQREFLNVLLVRPGASWRLVTFEDPDFDPGFSLELAGGHEHVMTLAVFADDTEAPMTSLAAEMIPAGEIITLRTSPALVARPDAAGALEIGEDHGATLNRPLRAALDLDLISDAEHPGHSGHGVFGGNAEG